MTRTKSMHSVAFKSYIKYTAMINHLPFYIAKVIDTGHPTPLLFDTAITLSITKRGYIGKVPS